MGNRAVIAFENKPEATGIYLHWNGGPESVLAFLHAADKMGARGPKGDTTYAMAGLCRAVTLFMHYRPGELLSMGVGPLSQLDCDNYDNGLYIVGDDWTVKERLFTNDSRKTVADLSEIAHGDWPSEREQYNGILAQILERHLMILEKEAEAA